jgi:hypothetical protein
MQLTLKDYIHDIHFNPQDIVADILTTAKKLNADYFSFIRFHDDYIQTHIGEFSNRLLKAAPIGIKDIILTQDYISSC